MRSPIRAGLCLAVAAAAALPLATPARAQIDPGCFVYEVRLDDVDAGRIFRTETSPHVFTEHWVLFANYVFPNAENRLHLTIRQGTQQFRTVAEYLAATVRPGTRYIKAYTTDRGAR